MSSFMTLSLYRSDRLHILFMQRGGKGSVFDDASKRLLVPVSYNVRSTGDFAENIVIIITGRDGNR